MEYLLDTNTLLRALFNDEKISDKTRNIIANEKNQIFVSIVSIWEIELKHNKHPDLMPYNAKDIINALVYTDYTVLPVRYEYLVELKQVIDLNIHKDPFDHLLIATALEESMTLITSDETILKYPIISTLILWLLTA